MISFIVIGRNEKNNLRRCLNSILDAATFIGILNYEIIYVDSKSTDKSIDIAKEFEDVKIVSILGDCSAAIGRNVGGKVSKGEILFFIDADMEIIKDFLANIIDRSGSMSYDFVSGQITDIIDGKNTERFSNQFLGGIFLMRRNVWEMVYGMRTKYKVGEDIDLGLRLYKKGYLLVRKPEVIANHYTISYLDKRRIWKNVLDKSSFCSRSVLYRSHILNKQMYQKLWMVDKTFVVLLLIIACGLILPTYYWIPISIYVSLIIIRSLRQQNYISVLEYIVYFITSDVLTSIYLFTYFPKDKVENFKEI